MGDGQAGNKRIFCVDLLRGLDIFYLVVVHYAFLVPGVFKVWPLKSEAANVFWLHSLSDIAGVRRGTWLFVLFGQCSLAAWIIMNFFGRSLTAAADRFVVGIPELIGTKEYQPVFVGIARMAIIIALVWMWRRFRRNRFSAA